MLRALYQEAMCLYQEAMCWWDFHELDELGYPPLPDIYQPKMGSFGGVSGEM